MGTTLADISRAVGVSITTVSKVLTGKADQFRISKKTQQKIWRTAQELDYAPDLHARSLRAQRTNQVGIVVSHFNDLWYGQVIHGIERVLIQNNYGFLINSIEEDPTKLTMCINRMRANRIEALILVGSRLELPTGMAERFKRSRLPIVHLNRKPRQSWLSSITFDHTHTGLIASQHLLNLGHRRIGMLLGPPTDPGNEARLTGYRLAFKSAHLEVDEADFEYAEPQGGFDSYRNGYEGTKALLERRPDLTAVVAFDDSVAIGGLRAIHELGRRVPEDFSIVGVDDSPQAEFATPPLTTVRLPSTEAGEQAAETAIALINGDTGRLGQIKWTHQGTLVVRASTGQI